MGTSRSFGSTVDRAMTPSPAVAHGSRSLTGASTKVTGRLRAADRLIGVLWSALAVAFAFTLLNVRDNAAVWEATHWTLAPFLAAVVALRGASRTAGQERTVRLSVCAALACWGIGQTVWDAQAVVGWLPVPGPSDVFFVGSMVPAIWAIGVAGRRHLRRADRLAVRLDAVIVLVALTTVLVAAFGREAIEAGGSAGLLLLFYPIGFSATAGAGLVSAVARRARASTYVLLLGAALQGVAWIGWLPSAIRHELVPGTPAGYLFSVSLLLIGAGAANWPGRPSRNAAMRWSAGVARHLIPIVAVAGAMVPVILLAPGGMGLATAVMAAAAVGLALGRQSMLLVEGARQGKRERAAHHREIVAEAALRQAAVTRATEAAWLASVRTGATPEETLRNLCAIVAARPEFEAAGMLGLDDDGSVEILCSVGPVPLSIDEEPQSLGAIEPTDGPWFGPLGRVPSGLLVLWLRHAGTPVGLMWAVATAGRTADDLRANRAVMVEFAALASAFVGSDLHSRRSLRRSRRAIEAVIATQAMAPVFQPIVELDGRAVIGYEALTRFDDGVRPDIRFAEATALGLGVPLETACLRQAFAVAPRLPVGTFLSVNVSPELVQAVMPLAAAMEGLESELVLELTEHARIDDYGRVRDAIGLLGGRVDVSVDDAGSGYASLRHILELGPRFVKLDISLVRGIDGDPARQAIVAGLAHFAATTGCDLIAEGIETAAELEVLRVLGIRLGQGYLLGRPAARPGA